MKKIICFIIVLTAVMLSTVAFAAETKLKPAAAELKRMSTFLSNFTELGFFDFDTAAEGPDGVLYLGNSDAASDLIRFGIWHNYRNNYKSRIAQCKVDNCEYGSLSIDGKHVVESVKKYFDLNLKNHSVLESDPPYYFDGKLYHFEGADGEATYYADIKEVWEESDKTLRMTGELYNVDDKDDRPATFEAKAKPYKFGGKNTWAILSMRSEWN